MSKSITRAYRIAIALCLLPSVYRLLAGQQRISILLATRYVVNALRSRRGESNGAPCFIPTGGYVAFLYWSCDRRLRVARGWRSPQLGDTVWANKSWNLRKYYWKNSMCEASVDWELADTAVREHRCFLRNQWQPTIGWQCLATHGNWWGFTWGKAGYLSTLGYCHQPRNHHHPICPGPCWEDSPMELAVRQQAAQTRLQAMRLDAAIQLRGFFAQQMLLVSPVYRRKHVNVTI